ncbi:TrmJ/YjtD family RNA methyltransferase [Candidatus Bathyarchaeota archaeon]|nr:TrmJ/YjtD family RNA methyltransferase [Candidatus Bathyarchaeota archaeon]
MKVPSYHVILVEPAFEESIGFVARVMKNFDLNTLHLVNPAITLGSQGRMRGAHAQEILDNMKIQSSLSDAIRDLDFAVGTSAQKAHSSSNLIRKPMSPKELASVVSSHTGKIGIVLGREGTGLNNHELSLCDAVVTIPTAEAYPTLNISHAAAIIFYELFQSEPSNNTEELASQAVRETIILYLSESMKTVGAEDYKIGLTARAMRNIMGRSAIRRREGSLIAGAFRQISQAFSGQRAIAGSNPGPALVNVRLED